MSLQVWLPLNGNLQNKGLADIQVSNIGTVAYNANGKIGKCYQRATSSTQSSVGLNLNTNFLDIFRDVASVAVWVKPLGTHTHYNGTILSSGDWNRQRWAFGVSQDNTKVDVLCGSYNNYINCEVPVNEWTHLVSIYDNGTCTLYKNGIYIGKLTNQYAFNSNAENTCIGRQTYASGYFGFNGLINDLRIYDHALSLKEVKEIAKGLVLHYPLDNNLIQILNNCYVYPTFQTSTSTGGWSHWGATGHQGTYGQNTDTNYIFKTGQTYSHWVANGTNATKPYLLYQSPAFAGGVRSLQCICKEENGLEINESIVFPDWNARNGGVPNYQWTSIKYLGNGFYYCKCEGIQQDGSNDLIGFEVKPGYKVYFSEAYVENNRAICSDIFFSSNIIYDTSGYQNNGTIINLSCSNDTIKNQRSTSFDGNTSVIQLGNISSLLQNTFTMNLWFKKSELGSKNYETLFGGPSGFEMDTRAGGSSTLSLYMTSTRGGNIFSPFNFNQWYMVTMVNDGTNELYYINGELKKTITKKAMPNGNYFIGSWSSATSQNYKGLISDFRLYTTALLEEDILQLYHTSAIADKNNNFYTGNFIEEGYNNQIEYFYNFKKNYGSGVLSHESDGLHLDGDIWVHHGSSEYISINPSGKTYKYDVVCSIDAGNQFYIGWERYDANKTARSNDACTYIVATKPTSDLVYKHYSGTVNLSTDGVNPCAFIRLRILNKWTGSTTDTNGTAIIHSLSLKEYSTSDVFTPVNISKTGLTKSTEILQINNIDKININRTQQINANNFIQE